MSQDLLIDLLAPPFVALVFLGMSWAYGHLIRGARPFTPLMRGMMAYGSLFVVGALYAVGIGTALGSRGAWIVLASAAWGLAIAFGAWRRHARTWAASPGISGPAQRKTNLRQGLAVVTLLISLIVASVEWDFVFVRQGHLLAALLWSAGVLGSILLAYGNRRTTVSVALRAYLVLAVIGAIAERSLPGIVLAACAGVVLFVLQRRERGF